MPLSAGAGEPDASDDSEQAKILVVDDLPEKLLVFRTILADLGHVIVCVQSGSEALRKILASEFAVILLDVNMPDIDGFETAGLIRQYKPSAHTPIIFVTSHVDEMQAKRGYSLGAVDYVLSPVVPEILCSKVKVFVDLHLMQRRLRRSADERVALAAAESARQIAEESTRRSNFLSQASRVLSGSLDVKVAAIRLLEMLVPQFVAKAQIALLDDQGSLGHIFSADVVDDTAPVRISQRNCADIASADLDTLRAAMSSMVAMRAAIDGSEAAIFPLVAAGASFGGLIVQGGAKQGDWDTIRELTERAAIALENARIYHNLELEIVERRAIEHKLHESNRRKDEFLAMLSHELRNPLAPIRSALEVVRRLAPAESKVTWAADVMGRQVAHLTRLVEDLLDVARIHQGKIVLQTRILDLRAVLLHGVETVQPLIEARGHRLTQDIPDTPVWLRGDFARLSQVVANLLDNAAKYTEQNGTIALSLAEPNQGQAVISVCDDGIGIDEETLPHVFDLFEQGKQLNDRGQGGLGVGLTLVRHLVQLHQGAIEVTSEGTGRGSQFHIRLPCCKEAVGSEVQDRRRVLR